MNREDQQAIAEKLSRSGITVERAEVEGGKIVSWTPIPWEAVTGRMMQFGWRFVSSPTVTIRNVRESAVDIVEEHRTRLGLPSLHPVKRDNLLLFPDLFAVEPARDE